jgi:RimJ/RimL family protein N-acetyltransferase
MAFVNNCVQAPEPVILENELYGPEPYDLNFVFPIPPELSTNKLRLIPFIPRVHAAAYLTGTRGHESMFKYMSVALEYPADLLRFVERHRRDKNDFMFAAIDTTRPDSNHPEWEGSLAGLFGLLETDKTSLVAEIGPAIVLPAFQRTHVSSHAVGLLLKYILELPPSGLGFRKVKWAAPPINAASNNLAKRMGFKLEGVLRWKCVLPVVEGYQKVGKEARAGDAGNGLLGRDTSNEWAFCWDDWEEGGRGLVERAFARVA